MVPLEQALIDAGAQPESIQKICKDVGLLRFAAYILNEIAAKEKRINRMSESPRANHVARSATVSRYQTARINAGIPGQVLAFALGTSYTTLRHVEQSTTRSKSWRQPGYDVLRKEYEFLFPELATPP